MHLVWMQKQRYQSWRESIYCSTYIDCAALRVKLVSLSSNITKMTGDSTSQNTSRTQCVHWATRWIICWTAFCYQFVPTHVQYLKKSFKKRIFQVDQSMQKRGAHNVLRAIIMVLNHNTGILLHQSEWVNQACNCSI